MEKLVDGQISKSNESLSLNTQSLCNRATEACAKEQTLILFATLITLCTKINDNCRKNNSTIIRIFSVNNILFNILYIHAYSKTILL